MFWSKDQIIERLSKIPRTLEDISIEIFEGLPSANDFLHRVTLSKDHFTDCLYACRNLQKNVILEQDLMYPYIDGALPNEFAMHSTQQWFMLPYEIQGSGIRKEYRLFEPEELRRGFPFAYSRFNEMKHKFGTQREELDSPDCYRLEREYFLHYMNTPKIIVTNHYSLQASYDPVGNYVFADGIGIVLGDPSLSHYITTVLNSSVARVFPEIWNREKMCKDNKLYAKMIKRFPIAFPEDERIESLLTTICRYQIYLNRQKNAANIHSLEGYCRLIDFFKRISDLLILDTYLTNDLDPKLLEILMENITSPEEEFEYNDDMGLLIALQTIKENILDSPDFRRCKFSNEFTNILATIKNDCFW